MSGSLATLIVLITLIHVAAFVDYHEIYAVAGGG